MFGVKIRVFKVKESIYVGFKFISFMPVIYVKLRAIFQPNGGRIDLFLLKWDYNFIFGFLCLIKPDCDRNTTF